MTKRLSRAYTQLISGIGTLLEDARHKTVQTINSFLVQTYWEVGKRIVEFEQAGSQRADYGTELLIQLSRDLSEQHGKGFSRSNLQYMRLLFIKYPICQTLSGKLGWSHYVELLGIGDDLARGFYEKQCVTENWSVRELKRQRDSALFERLALSRDKKGVLKLAKDGHKPESPSELVKDPYVLEFLKIPEAHRYNERELEDRLLNNLQSFLLELGKGFAFVARQHRVTLDNIHHYVDLVFYHRILKCFVLIDLKIGKVKHQDIGQMNMYLNYFKAEESVEGDRDPIGIVLAADKDEVMVRYARGDLSDKLFVSKYQLYLPDRKLLQEQVESVLSEKEEGT
ncbi:MAG TPA: hypothetical protein DCZ95_06100 [Verrucomicrobia bacterium]|nr:MAG: hypothetical protein A2X46_13215 [Lentisphaerae bacterium GWF2_57_35]HBA83650.1 hypothetical protein [Verrucomicrobiota bacterium]